MQQIHQTQLDRIQEQVTVRARIFALEQELVLLKRREHELKGVIDALGYSLQQIQNQSNKDNDHGNDVETAVEPAV